MFLATAFENNLLSLLIITMIFVDYFQMFNTETFQRLIFMQILAFAMIALGSSLIYGFLNVNPDNKTGGIRYLLTIFNVFYYFFQILSFFYVAVFIDYKIHKDAIRGKRFVYIAWTITGIFLLFLIFLHRYLLIIHIIFGFIPALVILIDITLSLKSFIKQHLRLVLIIWGAIGTGFLMDNIMKTVGLVWPCYSAALLYAYLLIIRMDSKLDALTGIGNRYAFNEFIEELAIRGTREENSEKGFSIAMIDIDNFKKINDFLGHAEGDNALRDMAAIIKRCIRHSDFAARYGGDEFIIAVSAEYDIQKVLERIQESMNFQNSKNLRPYKLEMSCGFDIYLPGRHKSMEDFLSHVDSLMYKQKEEHRRQSGDQER